MPKLTQDVRDRIENRKKRREGLLAQIPQYEHNFSCRLCGKAINVRTGQDHDVALRRHEKRHPQYKDFYSKENDVKMSEIFASLHDHDCVSGKCQCICGCDVLIGCTLIFGELCGSCHLRDIRGDDEHEMPRNLQQPDL